LVLADYFSCSEFADVLSRKLKELIEPRNVLTVRQFCEEHFMPELLEHCQSVRTLRQTESLNNRYAYL
jgi:hypothetical protein